MEIKVTLINKEEVKASNILAQIGDFARIGTDSGNPAEKIGKHCMDANHGSPQRVPRLIFRVEGVSRTFSHQWVRHNTGLAHNQRSQRYCIEDGFEYYKPKEFEGKRYEVTFGDRQYPILLSFDDLMEIDRQFYMAAIEDGIEADEAREALPNAVETKLNVKLDWQGMVHVANDRLCSRASRQIRKVVQKMVEEVRDVDPKAAEYLVPKCHYNALGYCPEAKKEWEKCMRRPHKSMVIPEFWKVKKWEDEFGYAVHNPKGIAKIILPNECAGECDDCNCKVTFEEIDEQKTSNE